MRSVMWALAALAATALADRGLADDANQTLADRVAETITTSGEVAGYTIEIAADAGRVVLAGSVAAPTQRDAVLRMVRATEGVTGVDDRIRVVGHHAPAPLALHPVAGEAPLPMNGAHGPVVEPEPVHAYAGGVTPYTDSPTLPPYSWPAYTPYNNYASMAYQTQYPSGAWPFIGPPYPYPMIPSGWRRVTLKWQKGYWFMKFHAH